MALTATLKKASGSLHTFKSNLEQAGRAATGLKQSTQTSNSAITSIKTSSQQSAKKLKSLQTAADKTKKSFTKAGKSGQTGGTAIGKFQSGAAKADNSSSLQDTASALLFLSKARG
ncbi:hypothetical protein [Streptomyces sp. JW3]|uniref:hypothetical protein n=1 Tax=Streptomyces sp. JW3 TaxID=3456955 RepID=UPI003FA4757C